MEKDGTIRMWVMGEGPGGIRATVRMEYPPDHAQYAEMLRRLGPMRPGDTKRVRPWSDDDDDIV
jgi:hypothetical protein